MRFLALCLALGGVLIRPSQAVTLSWNNASGGNWNTATNWNPNEVPDVAGEAALISLAGTYTVTMNISPTIDSLAVDNTAATLNLGGQSLTLLTPVGFRNRGIASANTGSSTIAGFLDNTVDGSLLIPGGRNLILTGPDVRNDGSVRVNTTGAASTTLLRFDDNVTVDGAGQIELLAGGSYGQMLTGAGNTVTQRPTHTIRGRGQVHAALVNEGTVQADYDGATLELLTNAKTNRGTFKTTNGGTLSISGCSVDNQGGLILAENGTVRLSDNALVSRGTLNSQAPSFIEIYNGTATLNEVANQGQFDIRGGRICSVTGPALHNEGLFRVNSTGAASTTLLRFDDNVTVDGAGQIELLAGGSYGQMSTGAGNTVTQRPTHTIRGRGQIHAALVNEGTVQADHDGGTLELLTNAKTNRGTFKTANGGTLSVSGCSIDNQGGLILAENGTVRLSDNALVSRGTLNSQAPSFIEIYNGTATLNEVANQGQFDIRGGRTCSVTGPALHNEGLFRVNSTGAASTTLLRFDDNVTVDGAGQIELRVGSTYANVQTGTGFTLTQRPAHTIFGEGRVTAQLVNEGTVRSLGSTLTVDSPLFTNIGNAESMGGATLVVTQPPTNYSNSRLTGGTWKAGRSSVMRLVGCPIDTSAATLVLEGPGSNIYSTASGTTSALANFKWNTETGVFLLQAGRAYTTLAALTNRGVVAVRDSSALTVGAGLGFSQTAGSLLVDGTFTYSSPLQIQGGYLGGSGDVVANVVNASEVRPGSSAGILQISGTYQQTAQGTLRIEIGGTGIGRFDRLFIDGSATLDGTIDIALVDGYQPDVGDIIEVLFFGSRTGDFAVYQGLDLGGGRYFEPLYTGYSLRLAVRDGGPMSVDPGNDPALVEPARFKELRLAGSQESGGSASLVLELPATSAVRLALFDAAGRTIGNVTDTDLAPGSYRYSLDAIAGRALPSGVYFGRAVVRSEQGVIARTARAVVVR